MARWFPGFSQKFLSFFSVADFYSISLLLFWFFFFLLRQKKEKKIEPLLWGGKEAHELAVSSLKIEQKIAQNIALNSFKEDTEQDELVTERVARQSGLKISSESRLTVDDELLSLPFLPKKRVYLKPSPPKKILKNFLPIFLIVIGWSPDSPPLKGHWFAIKLRGCHNSQHKNSHMYIQ